MLRYSAISGGYHNVPYITLPSALQYLPADIVAASVMVIMGSVAFNFEQNVEKILNGEGMEVTEIDSAPEQIKPVALKKTVCYIVSAVIFNSKVR